MQFNQYIKATTIIGLLLCTLLSQVLQAEEAPKLCAGAADKDNYDTDYLDNFITLKEGDNGWLFRDTDLLTSFGPSKKGYQRLRYITKLLSEYGTQLILVPIPTRGISHPELLGEINYDSEKGRQAYLTHTNNLRRIGIVVPQLTSLFEKEHASTLFFSRDHHWTSYGAEQVAKVTADTIKQQTFYKSVVQQEYETVQSGLIEMQGSHQKAAAKICGTTYKNETTAAYTTESISEMDLFGDVTEPEVVLVGTSNSNGKLDFNFSGYLMQYTGLDILNLAKSGSGYDGAILDYLASEEFKEKPPKLLIWEVPSYYRLNSKTFYKKMVRLLKSEQEQQNVSKTVKENMEVVSP